MSQLYKNSGGGGGSGIETINGDSGSITGSNVTIFANNATQNAGSTVAFVNSGTVSTLNVTDATNNVIIGESAGNATISGATNVGLGVQALRALTSGASNVSIGVTSLQSDEDGSENIAVGASTLQLNVSGNNNVAVGTLALSQCTDDLNTAIGDRSLDSLLTGTSNIAIGASSGTLYDAAETNNIVIGNDGIAGENNAIHIGEQHSHASCTIAGISGVAVSNAEFVTIDTTTGQLGSTAGIGGTLTTFSVAMAVSQNISQNTLSTIVYDTILADTASGYSVSTYTIPSSGNWFITILARFETAVSYINCDVFLNKNSGTFLMHLLPSTPSDGITNNNGSGSGVFPFVAGDTLQVQVFSQTVGSNPLSASGLANGYGNIFSGFKVS